MGDFSDQFPPDGPRAVPQADATSFREAMSRVAGAVHIVTTAGPGGRAGFTATSFTAVSDAPPTVLVCLNRQSRFGPVLERNGAFCVNTLAAGAASEAIADVFAGRAGLRGEERFAGGPWRAGPLGLPMLEGALVAFACTLEQETQVATHRILFGAVRAVEIGTPAAALVYRGRGYRTLP